MPVICICRTESRWIKCALQKKHRKEKREKWKLKTEDAGRYLSIRALRFFYTFAIYYFAVNTVQFICTIPDWSISTMTKYILNICKCKCRYWVNSIKSNFVRLNWIQMVPHYAQTPTSMYKIHFFVHSKNQMSPRRDSDIRIWRVC